LSETVAINHKKFHCTKTSYTLSDGLSVQQHICNIPQQEVKGVLYSLPTSYCTLDHAQSADFKNEGLHDLKSAFL